MSLNRRDVTMPGLARGEIPVEEEWSVSLPRVMTVRIERRSITSSR
jgi:hypothetical protein